MNDAAYFTAAIPEPFRILALKLKPFSLGHYILLRRFENPFVSDEAAYASREALIFAILVCSMSYTEFLAFIDSPNYLKEVKAWGKKVGIFDLPSKSELFQKYILDGSKEPEYLLKDTGDGKASSAHWSQGLLLALTSQCGYSRDEAMNAPLTQCFADWIRYSESQGMVEMISEEEKEMGKANAAVFEALAKEANGPQS